MERFSLRLRLSLSLLTLAGLAAPALQTQSFKITPHFREHFRGLPVAEGEVLVRFRAGASTPTDVPEQIDTDDDMPIGRNGWRRIHSRSRDVQTIVNLLSARSDVIDVEPDYVVHTTATPNDQFFPSMWGLHNTAHPNADIHAAGAWDVSTGSAANVVGVIDTGVDLTHPDLLGNLWFAPAQFTVRVGGPTGRLITCPKDSHGFNAIAFTCLPSDDNGHGTHTAGTIGAVGNNSIGVTGVNWTTRIMALKFLDSTGSGSTSDAILAIDFAIQAKAQFASDGTANVRVLSNSWGAGGANSSALQQEIQAAASAGILFVAAAGNSGTNNDAAPFYPASYPDASVVAVAATDETDAKASFSNYGPNSVDLAAPGVNISSTLPGGNYGALSGTSMATPHVAGAAALVLSACSLNTSQVKAALLNNVDVIPSVTGLVSSNGRLNVDRAIRSCATVANVPPTVMLTAPGDGATYTAPATITFTANASDSDGTIKRVDFYANGTLVASDATSLSSPYQASWTTNAAGNYTLTAVAVDNLDTASAPSTAVGVTVDAAANRVNVAAAANGGTALASSTYSAAYAASGAINGDRKGQPWGNGGGWNDGTPNAWPDWLEVDFNGSKTIDEVDVFSVQDNYTAPSDPTAAMTFSQYGLTSFTVQYWDGSQWLAVPNGAIAGNTLVWRQVNFAALTTTKIRVLITGALASWSRMAEVEAYQAAGPANAAPTVTLTAPGDGATYTAPATITFTANASDSDGTIKRVDFYANGTLVASDATSLSSPYQASWTTNAAGNYTLTAVAVDNLDTASAPSTAVGVTVDAAANRVNVAAAANGGTALASSTYSAAYAASGAINGDRKGQPWGNGGGWNDGTPNAWPDWLEVDFNGSKTIDEVDVFSVQDNYTAPSDPTAAMTFSQYGLTSFTVQYWDGSQWLAVPNGAIAGNTLVWRQVNFAALTTTKIRVLITGALASWSRMAEVEAYQAAGPANAAPTVTLTAPGDGATYTAPATITFTANASDSDGTIKRVDFYANGTLVASDATSLSSPYQASWTANAAGNYTLTAVAVDNLDTASAPSTAVGVTVDAAAGRTNVALAANGAIASASSTYNSGYAADGAINGDRTGSSWGNGGGWNDGTPSAWPDWLEVDFNGSKTIDEVDVFSVQDNYTAPSDPTAAMTFSQYGLTSFTVQYWDGSQWLTVPNGVVNGNNLVWRQVTFSPLTTTKIRILVNGALNTWSRITEVEAYQTP